MDLANNETIAKDLNPSVPVMILHGEDDVVVPLSNAEHLWRTLPETCRHTFLPIKRRNHNDLTDDPKVWEEIEKFIDIVQMSNKK